MRINEVLKAVQITQAQLAEDIGMSPALMSLKLRGERRWFVDQAIAAKRAIQTRKGVNLTVEELFEDR